MSKKIHICSEVTYKARQKFGESDRTRSPSFCGETKSPNFMSIGTYSWYDRYHPEEMDRRRICKDCVKWVPMHILATFDTKKYRNSRGVTTGRLSSTKPNPGNTNKI